MPTNPYLQAQEESYNQAEQDWLNFAQGPMPTAAPPPFRSSVGTRQVDTLPNYSKVDPGDTTKPTGSNLSVHPGWSTYSTGWWNEIPQATFKDIIDDPDKFVRMWGSRKNIGENTQRIVSDFAPMPVNYLYGLGVADQFTGDANNPMQKQADLQTQFFDRILTGQGGEYINPRVLMQTALNASITKDRQGNYVGSQHPLAQQFADPALPPEAQADNFIKYVASTVGNLIPGAAAQAYINILQREKQLFSDYITRNPTVNVPFNKWVRDRLGPNGGL